MKFKNVAITCLALGTAYGLGILSTVYWELKLLVSAVDACKTEQENGKYI